MSDPVNKPRKSALPAIIVTIVLLVILGAMSYGPVMKCKKASPRTQAVNKGKNLFVALTGFAKDNDDLFPCETTGKASTAEECFTQLLEFGVIDDEEIFWNMENTAIGTVKHAKPDNNGTLEAGENAWGYIKGLTNQSKTSSPLIFDSAVGPGLFDTGVWDGKAIVVKLNGSAAALDIEYSGNPTHDDGSSKQGPILEKRGTSSVDIFSKEALPEGVKIMLPTKP